MPLYFVFVYVNKNVYKKKAVGRKTDRIQCYVQLCFISDVRFSK